jgi:hypothetical protein
VRAAASAASSRRAGVHIQTTLDARNNTHDARGVNTKTTPPKRHLVIVVIAVVVILIAAASAIVIVAIVAVMRAAAAVVRAAASAASSRGAGRHVLQLTVPQFLQTQPRAPGSSGTRR